MPTNEALEAISDLPVPFSTMELIDIANAAHERGENMVDMLRTAILNDLAR